MDAAVNSRIARKRMRLFFIGNLKLIVGAKIGKKRIEEMGKALFLRGWHFTVLGMLENLYLCTVSN